MYDLAAQGLFRIDKDKQYTEGPFPQTSCVVSHPTKPNDLSAHAALVAYDGSPCSIGKISHYSKQQGIYTKDGSSEKSGQKESKPQK